ncbi:MAG TPA: YebC/PmpR family DNA-binding transcriptional regulator [Patescibacteria group bacterium]|jgi:YebC/PmpR family DNA-binding regulatory protein|nr:YebC/PmpR family DNA-binding transcriptional regulator [Patescibacteria group bacterium]
MSGHSKWATIKRAKGAADAKRGMLFTKLAKNIAVAVRTGGGVDPEFNFKLRMAVEKARDAAMPNDNIERAIKRGSGEGKEAIEQVTYEGYGPAGSAFIVEAITDNKNRTTSAVRNIFSKHGGRMGEQGSVSWMFESKGQILLEKQPGLEELPLELIDQGVEDVKEIAEGLEVYTLPIDLEKTKKFIEAKGFKILSSELIMRPQQTVTVESADAGKIQTLIDSLNEDDDVTEVYTNTNV